MKTFKQHLKEKQEYQSDETSQHQIAAGFKKIDWKPGQVNLDYGGGKYEKATMWLLEQGVTNLVYDPFNRPAAHNKTVLELADDAETTTCFNVLNVIKEEKIRKKVIKECKRKNTKVIYFTVYEGNKSGEGAPSRGKKRAWQNNMPLKDYLEEVKSVFSSSKIAKGMIITNV